MSYPVTAHKRAFEYYKKSRTIDHVAKEKGMPSKRTLSFWKEEFNCDCGYHEWDKRLSKIARKVHERQEKEEEHEVTEQIEVTDNQNERYAKEDLKTLSMLSILKRRIGVEIDMLEIKTVKEATSALNDIVKIEKLIKGEPTENINNMTTAHEAYNKLKTESKGKIDGINKEINELKRDYKKLTVV